MSQQQTPAADGYYHLAVAVMRQAVYDVRHGTPEQKARVRADIARGGLDYWTDVLCVDRHALQCVQAELQHLLASAA